jgi:hypothetical protein
MNLIIAIIVGVLLFASSIFFFWRGLSRNAGEGENQGEDKGYPHSRGKR